MTFSVRPHILINVAMSADGKIDTFQRRGAVLSSPADKTRVDHLRANVDAVMIGGRTLVDEDPKLTVKSSELRAERKARSLPENPAKVGIVTVAELKPDGDFMTVGPAEKYIFTTRRTLPTQVALLKSAGAKVFVESGKRVDLEAALTILYQAGLRTVMVEGGGRLIAELFHLGLVDEVYAYIAPVIFAGATAPTLADGPGFLQEQALRLQLESVEKFDDTGGVLIHYKIQHQP